MNPEWVEPEQDSPTVEGANYGSGKLLEQIDRSTLTPLFQHDHEHEYVIDPDDVTDRYYTETCTKCPMGRLVAK